MHQAFPRTRLTPPRSIIHAVASSVPSNYFQSRGAGPRKQINLIPVQVYTCTRIHARRVCACVKRMEEEVPRGRWWNRNVRSWRGDNEQREEAFLSHGLELGIQLGYRCVEGQVKFGKIFAISSSSVSLIPCFFEPFEFFEAFRPSNDRFER